MGKDWCCKSGAPAHTPGVAILGGNSPVQWSTWLLSWFVWTKKVSLASMDTSLKNKDLSHKSWEQSCPSVRSLSNLNNPSLALVNSPNSWWRHLLRKKIQFLLLTLSFSGFNTTPDAEFRMRAREFQWRASLVLEQSSPEICVDFLID